MRRIEASSVCPYPRVILSYLGHMPILERQLLALVVPNWQRSDMMKGVGSQGAYRTGEMLKQSNIVSMQFQWIMCMKEHS